MSAPAPIRAICFDLWNTLAWTDHSPHPITALASAFRLTGRPGWRRVVEEAIMTRPMSGIGEALEALTRVAGPPEGGAAGRRELALMWGAASNANRLYPDVIPALDRLRRPAALRGRTEALRFGLLSNTQSFDLDFLRRDGFDLKFHAIVLSCHENLLKPDPRIFLRAAERLGVSPAEILMVGDSPDDDVRGARGAGMRAIRIDRTSVAPLPGGESTAEPRLLRGLDRLEALLLADAYELTP